MMKRHRRWMPTLATLLLLALPAAAQDMGGDGMGGDGMDGEGMGRDTPAAEADADSDSGTKKALAKKLDGPAPGVDHLHLKDGRLLKGRITAEDDEAYAVKVGATIRVIAKSDVERIEKGPPAPAKPAKSDGGRDAKRKKGGKPVLTAAARDWALRCIEWVQSEDPAVRRSAAAALSDLGPAVVPDLRAAMKKAEGPYKEMLGRIAEQAAKKGNDRSSKQQGNPAADFRRFAGRLARSLDLDDTQRKEFSGAFGQYLRGAGQLMQDLQGGVISGDDAIAEAAGLRTTLRESLSGKLTDEQIATMDEQLDKYSRKLGAGKKAPNKNDRKKRKKKDAPDKKPEN